VEITPPNNGRNRGCGMRTPKKIWIVFTGGMYDAVHSKKPSDKYYQRMKELKLKVSEYEFVKCPANHE
jgi:hypothetical protein